MYRETDERDPLHCPRCRKQLPPLDVAACACGTWVTAFAASEVLSAEELAVDPITRWWRIRAPCPMCGEQMALRGVDPWFLQGCERHGFWIDADTIEHTRLGAADLGAIARKYNDPARADAERARLDRLELAAAAERERVQLLAAAVSERADQARSRSWHAARLAAEALEREARAQAAAREREARSELPRRLRDVLGEDSARVLLERLTELERKNDELSRRVTELEGRLARVAE